MPENCLRRLWSNDSCFLWSDLHCKNLDLWTSFAYLNSKSLGAGRGWGYICYPCCETGIQQDLCEKPAISHEAVSPSASSLTSRSQHKLYHVLKPFSLRRFSIAYLQVILLLKVIVLITWCYDSDRLSILL